jgi:hypothetical protein
MLTVFNKTGNVRITEHEARSRNHCFSGKAVLDILSVRARVLPYLPSLQRASGLSGSTIFFDNIS